MTSTTPRQPGRETSGHTGAGLIGDLRTGIDAGREARESTDRAYVREAARNADEADTPGASDASTSADGAGFAGESGAADRSGSGAPSAGHGTGIARGSLADASGGERASAGTNDANRSSQDHGNSLED